MKNTMIKKMMLGLTAAMAATTAAVPAALAEENTEKDIADEINMVYDDQISGIMDSLKDGSLETCVDLFQLSLLFHQEKAEDLGFTKQDLNGDGMQELVIGTTNADADGLILDLYTANAEGEVSHVAVSSERDRFYILKDGTIREEGSNSADQSFTAYYHIEDGKLVLDEAVIYDATVDADEPWFKNTEGLTVDAAAVGITEKQAEALKAQHEETADLIYTAFTSKNAEQESANDSEETAAEMPVSEYRTETLITADLLDTLANVSTDDWEVLLETLDPIHPHGSDARKLSETLNMLAEVPEEQLEAILTEAETLFTDEAARNEFLAGIATEVLNNLTENIQPAEETDHYQLGQLFGNLITQAF